MKQLANQTVGRRVRGARRRGARGGRAGSAREEPGIRESRARPGLGPRAAGVCAKLWLGRCPLSCPEEHRPRETHASLYSSLSPPAGARRLVRKLRKLVFLLQCQARSFEAGVLRLSPPTRCCSLPQRRACWSLETPRGGRLVWLAQLSSAPLASVKESRSAVSKSRLWGICCEFLRSRGLEKEKDAFSHLGCGIL